jgi:ribosomal-protein-alanine N-acetyltransferase
MTAFEIPTVVTARLRLRAFRAGDLDAYAAMQANPEAMRYLFTGQTANRVQVWLTMLAFTGSRPLRAPAPPARRMKRSSAGSSRRASKPSAAGHGRGNRNSG